MKTEIYRGVHLKVAKGRDWGHLAHWVNGVPWGQWRGSDEARALAELHGYVDDAAARPGNYDAHWQPGTKNAAVREEVELALRRGQGRHLPRTPAQAKQAKAGREAAHEDFPGNVRCGDALIGSDPVWRAAYEMTHHQLAEFERKAGREPHQWRPVAEWQVL